MSTDRHRKVSEAEFSDDIPTRPFPGPEVPLAGRLPGALGAHQVVVQASRIHPRLRPRRR